jgi:hypothetical protein
VVQTYSIGLNRSVKFHRILVAAPPHPSIDN